MMPVHFGRIDGGRRGALFLSLCLAVLAQSGCTTGIAEYVHNGFKVGPNYHRPPAPLPRHWIEENDPKVHLGEPNLAAWWEVFDDPALNALLQRSYSRNLTLRAAGFQILQAQAARAIACAELLPQSQSFNFQYTRAEASANGGNAAAAGAAFGASLAPSALLSAVPATPSTPVAGVTPTTGPTPGTTTTPTSPTVGTGVGAAGSVPGVSATGSRFFTNIATSLNLSWEVDFWGLFRRNLEAADASLDQSVENYDTMLVLLMANVATQYVEIRTLQKRLDLARKNVAEQEPLVAYYYRRYKAGIANAFPGYYQLKANLDNTKALIPQLEISLRQANDQLCVLLGIPVRDLLPELGDGTVPDPDNPGQRMVRIPRPKDESVVVGIPGDLLRRRPDVRAAERQLKIQSSQIGIAEAEMYPHIGINGSIGLAANSLAKLFNTRSWTGSIGPSLTWNIFNYGRLLANVRIQNYLFQQFVAQYQNTILTANQDAENSLVAYLKSLEQAQDLQNSAGAATKVTGYLKNQFKAQFIPPGTLDSGAFVNQLFTVINFQVTQQDAAAQAEGNIALNLILLYRALGGGWQIRLRDPHAPCRPSAPDEENLPVTAPLPGTDPAPPRLGPPIVPPDAPAEPLPAPLAGRRVSPEQVTLGSLDHVADTQRAFPQGQRSVLLEPLADLLLGSHHGAVAAAAEVLAHLRVGGAGVLAGQVHGQHARMAVLPVALLAAQGGPFQAQRRAHRPVHVLQADHANAVSQQLAQDLTRQGQVDLSAGDLAEMVQAVDRPLQLADIAA
jgi:NodT family efflux transporter outer membrane factor (OMF) lipoprotein